MVNEDVPTHSGAIHDTICNYARAAYTCALKLKLTMSD